ncbi:hypothetical protein ACFC0M_27425 [Streptomyces sp. NPDC056149]|uniref:hypothetical protein n=1 Tax=Streptomyces sp. NPDC056149 TaxID=3345728 RepID=UPI0035DF8C2D
MEPLAPAAVRAAGVVTKAALSRYRPAGVARVGSAEDRAQSYRRFLDAIAHVIDTQILYFYRRRDAEAVQGRRRRRLHARLVELRDEAWRNYTQAQHEVHAALLGIRLCAPTSVLAAAENLVRAVPRYYQPGTSVTLGEDDFLTAHDECAEVKAAFLEAARHDLAYNPRPWQLLRKWRERKYREQAAQQ